jgi:hypothetical protein
MVYSHTSLRLWRLCKRRWYHKYVLGKREATSINAAFSTWLVHTPIEQTIQGQQVDWEACWRNCLKESGQADDFKHSLFNVAVGKQLLSLYLESPVEGIVSSIETTKLFTFVSGSCYSSKPDFLVKNGRMFTVDLKLSTSNWTSQGVRGR